MILLVRHAHAGEKQAWTGEDRQRPLSASGWQEARGLLRRLDGFAISRIVSSPATRCLQTVDALAADRSLPVVVDARLAAHADLPAALAALFAQDGNPVLCTHGEVIGALLGALRERGAPISDNAEWPKGSTWILDTAAGAVRSATYLPPLRIAAPRPLSASTP